MKPILFFLLLLPACTAVPLKQAVGEALHKRIEAREESVQVCSCQTQYESETHGPAKLDCSIAEIPKN